ncbi:MAG: winged helix-turn-helix domain-containing protein [Firmicutes bacterium]|nr:winged helix-turn-helix domain-containing protein [Bacillota bacterium]
MRRRILEVLHDPQKFCKNKEDHVRGICVQDIARYLALPQSTISRHLRILSQAGLISQARQRTWHYYYLNKKVLYEAVEWLQNVLPPDDMIDFNSFPHHLVDE